ncbi:MAG: ferritin-like domain-containing protein [Alphaproteobacteria bacterium]|nr:ferritin-like domain-containing protein [Alphaproteobacteria bacterium]
MKSDHWTVSDLPWDQFDAGKVDPEILKIIKAAALVEYNAHDYANYLCNVFPDDPVFQESAKGWSVEEVQHGEALGAWAERADPSFNFRAAVARYTAGFRVNVNAQESIRGSRAGELIARCIVETGTSSYYTALADATEEPVLKAICRHIAADELKHYKLFYDYLKRYLEQEGLSRLERLKIGLGRIQESEDDELAYAYFAANAPADAVYDRPAYTSAYMIRAYPFYRQNHVERVVAMVFKACGFKPHTVWQGVANRAAWWLMQNKTKRAIRQAA